MRLLFSCEVWFGNRVAELLADAPDSVDMRGHHHVNDARLVFERIGEKGAKVLGTVRIAGVA